MDEKWRNVRKNVDSFLDENEKNLSDKIVLNTIGKGLQYEMGSDIKHVIFKLSRYKFVSKLFRFGKQLKVLELGCGEAIGSMVLIQNMDIKTYVGIDFDESSIRWNTSNLQDDRLCFILGDFNQCEVLGEQYYDVIVSLDVIEHISHDREDVFCQTIINHMNEAGVAVIGTPHINMDPYASPGSKIGHVNLFDQDRLYLLMKKYFDTVFIFNMNDEDVNLSFDKMSCYLFAVCCKRKENVTK